MGNTKKGFKIEQEVTYIAPDAQFVSLVKYAANRQPFTILKSEKGEFNMGKVMVSILIPNNISKAETDGYLKEYNNADSEKFDTYTKYRQVDASAIKAGTEEMIYIDTDTKVMGIVAELKTKNDTVPIESTTKKEAVDYATMATVFDEAYSMLDIIAGSMGQSGMENVARKELISSALKNFGTFIDQFFGENSDKSMKEGLDIKTVKGLVYPIRKESELTNTPIENTLTEEKVNELITAALENVNKTIKELSETTDTVQTEKAAEKSKFAEFTNSLKNVTDQMTELEKTVENLKSQPRTTKSTALSAEPFISNENDNIDTFKGTMFTSIS